MNTFKIIISGRVQGVGFRYFVYKNALKNKILGYVKNIEDGKVLIIALGEQKNLEVFFSKIKRGSIFSKVKECLIEKIGEENYLDFKIL